jgi:hypothetical protein
MAPRMTFFMALWLHWSLNWKMDSAPHALRRIMMAAP